MAKDGEWREEANCREMSVHDWFPEERNPSYSPEYKAELVELRAICAQCSFSKECLEDALDSPYSLEYGIYAGTTPQQRKKLLKEILDIEEEEE